FAVRAQRIIWGVTVQRQGSPRVKSHAVAAAGAPAGTACRGRADFRTSLLHGAFLANSLRRARSKSSEPGSTSDPKRATTAPPRPMRNFSKFHCTGPADCGLVSLEVRNL